MASCNRLFWLVLLCVAVVVRVKGADADGTAVDGKPDNSTGKREGDDMESDSAHGNITGRGFGGGHSPGCIPSCPPGMKCEFSFSGGYCVPLNPCHCLNGGTCVPSGSGYICECAYSFCGHDCSAQCPQPAPVDPCSVFPCLNGGFCAPMVQSGYQCMCQAGFFGTNCEYRTGGDDPCQSLPCLNGGFCRPMVPSGFSCTCQHGFFGTHCEYTAGGEDPCVSFPCLNNGVCTPDGFGSYSCSCQPGYTGFNCGIVPAPGNPCTTGLNPCHNLCECTASCRHASGYYCRSANGYLGKNCTVPPPVIQCLPNQVIVTVDDAFVREYDMGIGNSRLFLGRVNDGAVGVVSQTCFATVVGVTHTFTIHLPFSSCGVVVDTSTGNTVVTGVIWFNRITRGGYDMPVPVVSFECTYQKQYVIVTSLRPALDTPPKIKNVGFVTVPGVIELCKVARSCPNHCPPQFTVAEGAMYTVGEMIHVNIRGDDTFQGVLSVKSLYLSCDGSANSGASVVQLVSNGCPSSASSNYMPTQVTYSGIDNCVCVSFQVPRLLNCPVFYIHADLEICGVSGCVYNFGSCAGNFGGYGGRRRRHAETEVEKILTDVKGPIFLIRGAYGIPGHELFPNTTVVATPAIINDLSAPANSNDGEDTHWTILAVGISLLFVFIVISIALLATLYYRKSGFLRN